ncbi:tRNA (uracil-5-)-methyltransferase homolog A-like [Ornithodoros turicata]|uniref:tRNA (uracil-5-)-methyltransferase homolog A-like n=1 Tax=Ornithodoros turicata TaxID=34597 RepID=UPI003139236F
MSEKSNVDDSVTASTEHTFCDKLSGLQDQDHVQNTDDPYFYTKRNEFTSEIFKIEISNLPRIFGHGQLRKLLQKLKVNAHKVKVLGQTKPYAFVSFRCEEDRNKAMDILEGFIFKGKALSVKKANPMADPLVRKRKLGEESLHPDRGAEKSVWERVKEAIAPWSDIPYDEQLLRKEEGVKKIIIKYARQLEKNNVALKSWAAEQRKKYGTTVCALGSVMASPDVEGYRNKNEFSIGPHLQSSRPTVGFRISSYRQGSTSVVEPDQLNNVPLVAKNVTKSFQEYVRGSDKKVFDPETHEGYWRQLTVRTTRKNHVMAIVVIHPQQLTEEEIALEKENLKILFTQGPGKECGVTSLYLQRFDKKNSDGEQANFEHIFGTHDIEEVLSGLTFQISPDAFFQVNTAAAEILYDQTGKMANLNQDTTLLDVCCGTGTIGLTLSAKVKKVYGIETCKRAVDNARKNAEANGIKNASFVLGKAEDVIYDVLNMLRDSKELVAVVDPPRQGLHSKVLKTLRATQQIRKIVYISCNPAAALQNFIDLGRPTSNNYKGDPFVMTRATPVDMFPQTPHCELALLFERCTNKLPS